MNNMYAMVLFVFVITSTSSILSVSSNNDGDQEIFMVVDDPTSMHHAGMGMSKVHTLHACIVMLVYISLSERCVHACANLILSRIYIMG